MSTPEILAVAVDPGDKHVGWAEAAKPWGELEWHIPRPEELEPEQAITRLERNIDAINILVTERFRVYPQTATALIGTELETAQMIGQIKLLWRQSVRRTKRYSTRPRRLIFQDAHILKGTRQILEAQGFEFAAPKTKGGHALDAETHLRYRLAQGGF